MLKNNNLELEPVLFMLKAGFVLLEEISHNKELSSNGTFPIAEVADFAPHLILSATCSSQIQGFLLPSSSSLSTHTINKDLDPMPRTPEDYS